MTTTKDHPSSLNDYFVLFYCDLMVTIPGTELQECPRPVCAVSNILPEVCFACARVLPGHQPVTKKTFMMSPGQGAPFGFASTTLSFIYDVQHVAYVECHVTHGCYFSVLHIWRLPRSRVYALLRLTELLSLFLTVLQLGFRSGSGCGGMPCKQGILRDPHQFKR